MKNLMVQALLNSLPADLETEVKRMIQDVETKGAAEGVIPVPNVGRCRVTIQKLEDQ